MPTNSQSKWLGIHRKSKHQIKSKLYFRDAITSAYIADRADIDGFSNAQE